MIFLNVLLLFCALFSLFALICSIGGFLTEDDKKPWLKAIAYLLAAFLVTSVSFWYLDGIHKEKIAKANTEKESIWKAQGCPVYKSECGSKHKYACEQKASTSGRVQIGDIFVEAYSTCGAK